MKPPDALCKFHGVLTLLLVPFFYSVCTRLPFVCIAIVLWKIGFGFEAIAAGICGYQIMRGCSNSIQKQGNILMRGAVLLFGAILGYAMVVYVTLKGDSTLMADRSRVDMETADVVVMLIGFTFVGFAEIYTCIQWMCKHWAFLCTDNLEDELDYCRHCFKQQYCVVNLGATVAFFVGGLVFENAGLRGVALLGLVDAVVVTCLLLVYRLIDKPVRERMGHGQSGEQEHNSPSADADARPGATEMSVQALQSHQRPRKGPFQGSKPKKVAWIGWFVAVTFGFQSASIGVILSIGPFFWFNNFNLDIFYVGLLMALGELLGFVETLLDLNSHVVLLKRYLMPNPWSIVFLLLLIMLCDYMYMTMSFWPIVVAQVIIQGCNGMCVAVLTEIQGCIIDVDHYQYVAGVSQVVRRVGNVSMAAMAPIVYNVYPGLPFLLAGILTMLWCTALTAAFVHRRHELEERVKKKYGEKSAQLEVLRQKTFIGEENWVSRFISASTGTKSQSMDGMEFANATEAATDGDPGAARCAPVAIPEAEDGGDGDIDVLWEMARVKI